MICWSFTVCVCVSLSQEVLNTPLPIIIHKWSFGDYVMAGCAVACAAIVAVWVLWRAFTPYRACMKERRRLARKFAPNEADPAAILRPDIMFTRQDDQIRKVGPRVRARVCLCAMCACVCACV